MPNITLTNTSNNYRGYWGHQLRGEKREVGIRIMFKNIRGMGNTSYQPIQHKLNTLKHIMINEGMAIVGLSKVKINWIKIPVKEKIYNRTDGWSKNKEDYHRI